MTAAVFDWDQELPPETEEEVYQVLLRSLAEPFEPTAGTFAAGLPSPVGVFGARLCGGLFYPTGG